MNPKAKGWRWLVVLVSIASLLAACGGTEGERLLQKRCTSCHEKAEVVEIGRTREDWTRVVNQMSIFGAELDEDEQDVLIEYLAETYGP